MSSARTVPRRLPLLIVVWLCLCTRVQAQDSLAARSPEDLLSRARYSLSQKRFTESIVYYRSYLKLRANDDDVRNELARTFSWNSEYDSALACYGIVLTKNQDNFDARIGRCRVLAWKHEDSTAIRETDALLQIYPRNTELLEFAASLHLTHRDPGRSLELYRRALSVDPGSLDALLGECRALRDVGRSDEAFDKVRRVRDAYPGNSAVAELYSALRPKPRNQFFIRYQNESFDVQNRTDHRTVQAQYYLSVAPELTVYVEADAFRRFDQNDQSFGAGAYYSMSDLQSLYGYVLLSPNPKITSTVDASMEYDRLLDRTFSVYAAYRFLDFRTEKVHIISPGLRWTLLSAVELKPRVYVSRTVEARKTSTSFSVQCGYTGLERLTPYVYYAVGSEAYRGVTLDNVESSDSWSLTAGAKYEVTDWLTVRANYQYLSRIGFFHDNSIDVGVGYLW